MPEKNLTQFEFALKLWNDNEQFGTIKRKKFETIKRKTVLLCLTIGVVFLLV